MPSPSSTTIARIRQRVEQGESPTEAARAEIVDKATAAKSRSTGPATSRPASIDVNNVSPTQAEREQFRDPVSSIDRPEEMAGDLDVVADVQGLVSNFPGGATGLALVGGAIAVLAGWLS